MHAQAFSNQQFSEGFVQSAPRSCTGALCHLTASHLAENDASCFVMRRLWLCLNHGQLGWRAPMIDRIVALQALHFRSHGGLHNPGTMSCLQSEPDSIKATWHEVHRLGADITHAIGQLLATPHLL